MEKMVMVILVVTETIPSMFLIIPEMAIMLVRILIFTAKSAG